MLPEDMLNTIINNADINTANQYMQITKKSVDEQLQTINNKLMSDNIIQIKFDNYRKFDAVNFAIHEHKFNTKNKYIILYNLMVRANKEARAIVKINYISLKREHFSTNGIITIVGGDNIHHYYTSQINKFSVIPKNYDINQIYLDNDGNYQIETNMDNPDYYEHDSDSEYFMYVDCTEKEIIDVITLILFDGYIGLNEIEFINDKNIKFSRNQSQLTGGDINRTIMYITYDVLKAYE